VDFVNPTSTFAGRSDVPHVVVSVTVSAFCERYSVLGTMTSNVFARGLVSITFSACPSSFKPSTCA
jgi:hypothetical protein